MGDQSYDVAFALEQVARLRGAIPLIVRRVDARRVGKECVKIELLVCAMLLNVAAH